MASGLNVIPIGGINNPQAQQYAQALRNLEVGRGGFLASVSVIVQAVEAPGGSTADLAQVFGITAAQADVLYAQSTAFKGFLTDPGLVAAWDQMNAIMGIMV
jgi:hypothetical protein